MAVEGPLGLSIPEQTRPGADAFLLNPEKAKAWIADLPLANVGETSRRVFKAIFDCNRTAMSPGVRMQIAEEFREPIAHVDRNLRKHYIGAPRPLAPKSLKIAILNRELHAEMALSQKIIITDLCSGRAGQFDREPLDQAIQKTLGHLKNTLLHSYLAYESCPRNTWREVHGLAAHGLPDSLPTPDPAQTDNRQTGHTCGIYTEILLLAVSAPYELRQREILSVSEKIHEWGSHARLLNPLSIQGRNDIEGLFVTDLASDSPPRHISLVAEPNMGHSVVLDTGGLIEHVERRLRARASKTTGRGDTDKALLKKLLQAWRGAPKRRHPRTKLHFDLKIAVGLNAIWELLTADRGEQERSASPASFDSAPETSKDSGRREQIDMLQHRVDLDAVKTGDYGDLSLSSLDDSRPRAKTPGLIGPAIDFGPQKDTLDVWSSHDAASLGTHVVRTVDESAGGYCVSWKGEYIPRVTVGELVGIQSPTHETQYALAAIRWVKNMPEEGLKLGMQLLAHTVLAAKQSPEPGKGQQSQLCLLAPALKATASPASLICPALRFQVGDSFRLKQGDEESHIRLTRHLEQTDAYARFLFASVEKEQNNEASENEFDSIWSEL